MNQRRARQRQAKGIPSWAPEAHLRWQDRDLAGAGLRLLLWCLGALALGVGAALLCLTIIGEEI